MPALAVWTPEDGLLGALAPLGLAAAAPAPALVVDLDEGGPRYPGDASLADLVADSPRLDDLRPSAAGTAVLRNGGVSASDAAEVVEAMAGGWPYLVLRVPPRRRVEVTVPVVPVRMLLPGGWFEPVSRPAVHQATAARMPAAANGIRLPVPSRGTVGALLRGQAPPRWDRWIRAWRRVWEAPWGR
ncbi:MAG: hypothetical protein KQH83_04240 [Actinobacteria bacterium]|nr:hypothetical protein [Actinomycetota bacterium]